MNLFNHHTNANLYIYKNTAMQREKKRGVWKYLDRIYLDAGNSRQVIKLRGHPGVQHKTMAAISSLCCEPPDVAALEIFTKQQKWYFWNDNERRLRNDYFHPVASCSKDMLTSSLTSRQEAQRLMGSAAEPKQLQLLSALIKM